MRILQNTDMIDTGNPFRTLCFTAAETIERQRSMYALVTGASAGIGKEIAGYLRSLGFRYVTLDLDGFSSGSMNRPLG